jgi:hypothetical protein
MSITKEQLKDGIKDNNTFPDGDLELIDLRNAVDELREECVDEFDVCMEQGTTIPVELLKTYLNLENYDALLLTIPRLPGTH